MTLRENTRMQRRLRRERLDLNRLISALDRAEQLQAEVLQHLEEAERFRLHGQLEECRAAEQAARKARAAYKQIAGSGELLL